MKPLTLESLSATMQGDIYSNFPGKDHTPKERRECIRIRIAAAKHLTKLIATAERNGKLPSSLELMRRHGVRERAIIFAP